MSNSKSNTRSFEKIIAINVLAASILSTGCDNSKYTHEKENIADSWIIYIIDENRYFEMVPTTERETDGKIYYHDIKNNIHSFIIESYINGTPHFLIDAQNTNLLIGFPIYGKTDCIKSNGINPEKCYRFPYSVDSGRTWRLGYSPSSIEDMSLIGDQLYVDYRYTNLNDLAKNNEVWKYHNLNEKTNAFPKISKRPTDLYFRTSSRKLKDGEIVNRATNYPDKPFIIPPPNDPNLNRKKTYVYYIIDKYRYFTRGYGDRNFPLYYNDTKNHIHTFIGDHEYASMSTFKIDASNKNYLVGPRINTDSACTASTQGSYACHYRFPYSIDGGKTWKYAFYESGSDSIQLIGSKVYAGYEVDDLFNISNGKYNWHEFFPNKTPSIRNMPHDLSPRDIGNPPSPTEYISE